MKPTETEQMLLDWMSYFPLKDGQRLRIFLMMETEQQMLDMMTFMSENKSATAENLMDKAVQITGGLK